jgi:N-acetylglucosamine-6-phosphate deacetylase
MLTTLSVMSLLVHSVRKLDADGHVDDFWLVADGLTITATGTGDGWRKHADRVGPQSILDGGGHWLTPGFIDLHGHGGGGHAFDDGPAEIRAALATHRRRGTTRSVVSLVANPLDALERSLAGIADIAERDPLVLGSHLEGPYLASARRGAHSPDHVRSPEPAEVERLIAASRGTLRQITIAPELPGALESIDVLTAAGVTVAVGHTEATFDQATEAFHRGARLLTHAFNAMSGIHHRRPGPVVAAMENPLVTLELILDGLHVHPSVARLLFAGAPGRVALVTDAMAAAGSEDGDYRLGDLNVTVKDGRALLSGTGTIAGSTLTQDAALRIAITGAGVAPEAAVAALTLVPARALGIEAQYGLLKPGHVADAVLFDSRWHVLRVWAYGAAIPTEGP